MAKMQKIRIHIIMEMRTVATRKKSFRAGRAKVRPAFLYQSMQKKLPVAKASVMSCLWQVLSM